MRRNWWALLLGFATLGPCCADRPPPPKWTSETASAPTAAPTEEAPARAEVPDESEATYPAAARTGPPLPPPAGQGLEVPFGRYLVVDQFGYRPNRPKVAVLADPKAGWNAPDAYTPGPELEVRNWSDGKSVFRAKSVAWQNGEVDAAAGDRGAWFAFTPLEQPGLYYVYDPTNKLRSHPFAIGADVYRSVLRAATKMFYFNRANVAKTPPHSCDGKRCWNAAADNVGPGQDREARSVTARDDPKTARDLSGGWWDAGDTNKYVTFANDAVHQLLTAYAERPDVFRDDFGIPESGNGVPDLVDEVLVELSWLKKMQPSEHKGGALLKLGAIEYGDPVPEENRGKRYYYPKPCSSATIVVSSLFAHAALVLKTFPRFAADVANFGTRARDAWNFYQANPHSDSCDDGTVKSGDADLALEIQEQTAVTAAVYLFALTGDASFGDFVRKKYETTQPFKNDLWSAYYQSQGDALLYYASLANADATTKAAIQTRLKALTKASDIFGFRAESSLYRAYVRKDMMHWGSNNTRASVANTNYDLVQYGLLAANERESFVRRAEEILHFFHGVNPMQLVYLTNLYGIGGDACADETYHAWFKDGHSKWDNARESILGPAPGYFTGGPNTQYCQWQNGAEHACANSPVRRQPPEKAYLDSNRGYEPKSPYDKTWELSEPAIYYQASYVRLVSKFVD